jgi:hypothetical protein
VQESKPIQRSQNIWHCDAYTQCETLQLYNFTKQIKMKNNPECQFYILVPLNKLYIEEVQSLKVKNISVMTSLSDTFLQKYTNRPLKSTKNLLANLFATTDNFTNVKLYVSCLSYCQYEGPQKINNIIQEILFYNTIPGISEICLTDTFGALQYNDFRKIIEGLKNNMDFNKLSVRLCATKTYCQQYEIEQENNLTNIIQFCIKNNIYQFDIISDIDDSTTVAMDSCKIINYNKLYDDMGDYAELAYYG